MPNADLPPLAGLTAAMPRRSVDDVDNAPFRLGAQGAGGGAVDIHVLRFDVVIEMDGHPPDAFATDAASVQGQCEEVMSCHFAVLEPDYKARI